MNDFGKNLLQIDGDQDVPGLSEQGIYTPYQYMVKLNVYPQSNKYRFLVKHPTGSGKTLTGLLVAQNFYTQQKQVLIITFNQAQFINELMSVVSLGFISNQEQYQMKDPDVRHIIEIRVMRRVREYVTIIGYKEFNNLLLGTKGQSLNQFILDKYKGGLVLCDEIHNAYKHEEQNTYGIALQLFNLLLQKNVYMVYMSATPLTYSHEIQTILQLMHVGYKEENAKELLSVLLANKTLNESYSDPASLQEISLSVEQLVNQYSNLQLTKQNIHQRIYEICEGNLSFIPELVSNMPTARYKGVEYEAIKTLFIVPCYIQGEFKEYIKNHNQYVGAEWRKYMYLPTKREDQKFAQFIDQHRDVYKSKDISKLFIAQQEFLNPKRLTIGGKWLDMENLPNYCPKLAVMMAQLLRVQSKSFIYINDIVEFGVELVISVLKYNGLLIMDQSPNANSICYQCKISYHKHEKGHEFIPYRVVVVTGENAKDGEKYLSKFNDISNFVKPTYHIVLGSIKLKEGYNLYGVNNVFILTMPYNLTNFIQVLGRAIRYKSHERLPQHQRYVDIYFLVTSIKGAQALVEEEFTQGDKVSREELEVFTKMKDFQEVLQYERIINSLSVDINYYNALYFKTKMKSGNQFEFISNNQLKMLDFSGTIEPPRELDIYKDDLTTFYLLDMQHTIDQAITRRYLQCFNLRPVWLLDELVEYICKLRQMPNLDLLPKDIIIQKIMLQSDVKQIGKYIVQQQDNVDVNFFLNITKKPFILIGNNDFVAKSFEMPLLNKCFEYLSDHYPKYVDCITNRQFIETRTYVDLKQTQKLYSVLQQTFQDSRQDKLINEYKQYIIRYNAKEDLKKAVNVISCLHIMYPLILDTSRTQIYGFVLNHTMIEVLISNDQWAQRDIQQSMIQSHILIAYPQKNDSSENQIYLKHGSQRQRQGYRCISKDIQDLQKLTKDTSTVKKQYQCDKVTTDALTQAFNCNLNFVEQLYVVFKFNA